MTFLSPFSPRTSCWQQVCEILKLLYREILWHLSKLLVLCSKRGSGSSNSGRILPPFVNADWWSGGGDGVEGGRTVKTWQFFSHAKGSLSLKEPSTYFQMVFCQPGPRLFAAHFCIILKDLFIFSCLLSHFSWAALALPFLKFTLQQMGLPKHQAQAKKSAAGHRSFLGEHEKDRSRLPSALGEADSHKKPGKTRFLGVRVAKTQPRLKSQGRCPSRSFCAMHFQRSSGLCEWWLSNADRPMRIKQNPSQTMHI